MVLDEVEGELGEGSGSEGEGRALLLLVELL
jgi:hypothetical protein